MERVTSGIMNFDDKMEGGFVPGSVILIAGKTGTLKTALAASFINEGAKKGESSLYITTEELEQDIRNDIKHVFGWDFDAMMQNNLVNFISIKPIYPDKALNEAEMAKITKFFTHDVAKKIVEAVTTMKAKRLVIDSISIFEMFIKDVYLAKISLMALLEQLRKTGVTTLITGEIPESSDSLSKNEIIEYVADGVIKLDFVPVSEKHKRTIYIRKMRRTNHSSFIYPINITKDGLKVVDHI